MVADITSFVHCLIITLVLILVDQCLSPLPVNSEELLTREGREGAIYSGGRDCHYCKHGLRYG